MTRLTMLLLLVWFLGPLGEARAQVAPKSLAEVRSRTNDNARDGRYLIVSPWGSTVRAAAGGTLIRRMGFNEDGTGTSQAARGTVGCALSVSGRDCVMRATTERNFEWFFFGSRDHSSRFVLCLIYESGAKRWECKHGRLQISQTVPETVILMSFDGETGPWHTLVPVPTKERDGALVVAGVAPDSVGSLKEAVNRAVDARVQFGMHSPGSSYTCAGCPTSVEDILAKVAVPGARDFTLVGDDWRGVDGNGTEVRGSFDSLGVVAEYATGSEEPATSYWYAIHGSDSDTIAYFTYCQIDERPNLYRDSKGVIQLFPPVSNARFTCVPASVIATGDRGYSGQGAETLRVRLGALTLTGFSRLKARADSTRADSARADSARADSAHVMEACLEAARERSSTMGSQIDQTHYMLEQLTPSSSSRPASQELIQRVTELRTAPSRADWDRLIARIRELTPQVPAIERFGSTAALWLQLSELERYPFPDSSRCNAPQH